MNTSIKPRDRVINALNHKESDICPYYIWIHPDMVAPIADYYGDPKFQRNYICDHSLMKEVRSLSTPLTGDRFIDEFGCEWRQGAALHVEEPALKGPSLKGYTLPDLTSAAHYDGIEEWLDENADRFKVIQLGMLFFECTWRMRGFENVLMDFYLNPQFMHELLDALEQMCNGVIDQLIARFGDKIDAIGFSDDYGGEQAMLISPQTYREFIKPRTRRMYERIHKGGRYVYLHSCGNVTEIIPDIIEIGVDILQPIQPEAMDIFKLKRLYGKDICFYGGISTQHTLPFGTAEDVLHDVNKCLEIMAPGGGYVMAPAKPILPGVPLKNAITLIDAFVNQNRAG